MKITFFVNRETAKARYEICKGCEFFIRPFGGCEKCGCIMPAKVTISKSECPVGKWGAVQPDSTVTERYEYKDEE